MYFTHKYITHKYAGLYKHSLLKHTQNPVKFKLLIFNLFHGPLGGHGSQVENPWCEVLGAMKGVMNCRGLGMNVKKVLYEKVIVPTVTYGSECWGMKVSERRKLNVFEMRCLRSMAGVSRMDRVRNEVVRQRTGVEVEMATGVDMNVWRWFGHVEKMNGY